MYLRRHEMIAKALILFGAHFVGDYALQTGFIAEMKGKTWLHLTAHVSIYTLTIWVIGKLATAHAGTADLSALAVLFVFVTHFFIDAAKARWKVIKTEVTDQALHLIVLLIVLFL